MKYSPILILIERIMTKGEDRLFFTMTVMFMFTLFGHNLRSCTEPSKEEREKAWIESVLKNIENRDYSAMVESYDEEIIFTEPQPRKTVKRNIPKHKGIVTVTQYNPVIDQCDEDPLVTADNSIINLKKLKKHEIRWVAVSRDLTGFYRYGDIIELKVPGKSGKRINGRYVVHDTMNPRFTNRIDILTAVGEDMGMWENVTVKLVSRKQGES